MLNREKYCRDAGHSALSISERYNHRRMRTQLVWLLLLVALSSSTSGQQKSAPTAKPISHFMREIGLLYLEDVKDMLEQPRKEGSESRNYEELLNGFEDRIEINISTANDKRYFELLKRTRAAADHELVLIELGGHQKTAIEAMEFGKNLDMYPECQGQAWATAKSGVLESGNCTQARVDQTWQAILDQQLKISAAELEKTKEHLAHTLCGSDATYDTCESAHIAVEGLRYEPSSKPLPKELIDKCTPFADGSVEKVLAKTMSLPPKECRQALGWMRDSRLNTLYGEQH